MLHRFIPKRERIADYTSDEVMIFVDIINGPPYKWLGYHKDFSPPNLNVAMLHDPLMHNSASVSLGAPLSSNMLSYKQKIEETTSGNISEVLKCRCLSRSFN